jgi:hypothetical protein
MLKMSRARIRGTLQKYGKKIKITKVMRILRIKKGRNTVQVWRGTKESVEVNSILEQYVGGGWALNQGRKYNNYARKGSFT